MKVESRMHNEFVPFTLTINFETEEEADAIARALMDGSNKIGECCEHVVPVPDREARWEFCEKIVDEIVKFLPED